MIGYRRGGKVSREILPLPEKLRMARARKALSLRKAAELAGVSAHSIGAAERGDAIPHDSTLRKLAEVYEVDVSELMEAKLGYPLVA
jgi:transcriptional regulator with XRE-family HTH domain